MTGAEYSNYNENRTLVLRYSRERGNKIMSQNEIELFNMLHENNAEQAVLTAIKVFSAFLEQLAEDPKPPAAYPLESA